MTCPECTAEAETPDDVDTIIKHEMCGACLADIYVPKEPLLLTNEEIEYGKEVAKRCGFKEIR